MGNPASKTADLPVLTEADESGSRQARQLRQLRVHHRNMLIGSAIVLCLAFVLRFGEGQRVTVAGIPLPPLCASQAIFGAGCPGCGLTRSFVLLAHGDWHAARKMHRIGWVLALAMLAQFPYRTLALRSPNGQPLGRWFPQVFGYLLIALLIGNWLLQMPSTAP